MIDEKLYWDNRYSSGGNSGNGSYGQQLEKKLGWLTPLEFETITEVGCGDFNFGKSLLERHPAQYVGMDISEAVLENNRKNFPRIPFLNTSHDVPPGDLLLCIDVLFHILDDSTYEATLATLENAWTKYLAVTAYEYDRPISYHIKHRAFDTKRFGEPVIREVVEEDGQLYFYLFKRG